MAKITLSKGKKGKWTGKITDEIKAKRKKALKGYKFKYQGEAFMKAKAEKRLNKGPVKPYKKKD